ncbi:hypothetical protein [Pseudoduganella sp.]|uniref:hypothetical protein n=1 Tax=Pseudoduganella sp. TaxID=1880898 RepID=UPI0035AE1CE6
MNVSEKMSCPNLLMKNSTFLTIIVVSLAFLSCPAFAADKASCIIFDGNPVAVKYASGKLKRLPSQDANDVERLLELEAVSALIKESQLSSLSQAMPASVRISPPRMTEYGVAMFEVLTDSPDMQRIRTPNLVWSGPPLFRQVRLDLPGARAQLKRSLIARSHRVLQSKLDFRSYEPVGRRLKLDGPVKVRDYGRTASAPHLAFVAITWRIKDLPETLSDHGMDSLAPFFRVEYVVDTRTGKPIYRNTTNVGGIEDWDLRLFKEPNGPLMMAVTIKCSDGAEPFILDLENESYGTVGSNDVPEVAHCFPAQ